MAAGLSSVMVFAAERSYDLGPATGEEGGGGAAGDSGPALAKGHWMLQQVPPLVRAVGCIYLGTWEPPGTYKQHVTRISRADFAALAGIMTQ